LFVKLGIIILISPCSSNNHEDVHKEVDNVEINVESSEDVLLRAKGVLVLAPHHQLGVIHDVEGEDEGTNRSISNHSVFGLWEENEKEPSNHEDYQNSAEHSSTHGEVYLGLERKDSQTEGDSSSDSDSDEDGIHIVEGGDGAQHHTLAEGENPQEDEVGGELPPDTVTAGHGQEAHQHDPHASVVHPHVSLHIRFNSPYEHEDANHCSCKS